MGMAGTAVLADGTRHEFTSDHRDARRYELLAAKRQWPGLSDAPLHSTAVIAWCALVRENRLNGMPIEAWLDQVVDLADLRDESPDPTQPNPGNGSSSP